MCKFGRPRLAFIGDFISMEGIEVDLEKITAMTKWQRPANLHDFRSVLGHRGYYCHFAGNYGMISFCLTAKRCILRGKRGFQCCKALDGVDFGLALPIFVKPFEIAADTSGQGLG